jgi:hypothetical protein
MLPIYAEIMKFSPAPRLLVYSGDVDGIVPVTGNTAMLLLLQQLLLLAFSQY